MRKLVTFIVRLWVNDQAEPPAWEGRVECVATGERAHVRGPQEVARFIQAQAVSSPGIASSPADGRTPPGEKTDRPGPEQKRSAQ